MTLPAMNTSSFPMMYERFLVEPLFRPFAEALLDAVSLRQGDRVLDVACGTGITARLAEARVGPSGRVVGVDLSPQMLAVARHVSPGIDWREGSAESLPLEAGERFNVVTCHQGFQFFPDRDAAAREFRRALDVGGRLAVAAWRSVDALPFIAALHRVAERHLGHVVDRRHSISDARVLEDALSAAGLEDVEVNVATRTVRFEDPTVFARLNAMALISMSQAGKELADDRRDELSRRIVDDSAEVLRDHTDARGLAFELSTFVARATVASHGPR